MPLIDNSFYNACLYASALLLSGINIFSINTYLDRKYKNLEDNIDMRRILNYREKHKNDFKKLSGNAIAADCVKGLEEKANTYHSHISLS